VTAKARSAPGDFAARGSDSEYAAQESNHTAYKINYTPYDLIYTAHNFNRVESPGGQPPVYGIRSATVNPAARHGDKSPFYRPTPRKRGFRKPASAGGIP